MGNSSHQKRTALVTLGAAALLALLNPALAMASNSFTNLQAQAAPTTTPPSTPAASASATDGTSSDNQSQYGSASQTSDNPEPTTASVTIDSSGTVTIPVPALYSASPINVYVTVVNTPGTPEPGTGWQVGASYVRDGSTDVNVLGPVNTIDIGDNQGYMAWAPTMAKQDGDSKEPGSTLPKEVKPPAMAAVSSQGRSGYTLDTSNSVCTEYLNTKELPESYTKPTPPNGIRGDDNSDRRAVRLNTDSKVNSIVGFQTVNASTGSFEGIRLQYGSSVSCEFVYRPAGALKVVNTFDNTVPDLAGITPPAEFTGEYVCKLNGEDVAAGAWSVTGQGEATLTPADGTPPADNIPVGANCSATQTAPTVGATGGLPIGYAWNTAKVSNAVTIALNDPQTITVTNAATTVNGTVTWSKTDGTDALGGSEWKLTGPGEFGARTITDCVTDAPENCDGLDQDPGAGKFTVQNLPWGTYSLAETSAPSGYLLDGTPHSFTVDSTTFAQAGSTTINLGDIVNLAEPPVPPLNPIPAVTLPGQPTLPPTPPCRTLPPFTIAATPSPSPVPPQTSPSAPPTQPSETPGKPSQVAPTPNSAEAPTPSNTDAPTPASTETPTPPSTPSARVSSAPASTNSVGDHDRPTLAQTGVASSTLFIGAAAAVMFTLSGIVVFARTRSLRNQ